MWDKVRNIRSEGSEDPHPAVLHRLHLAGVGAPWSVHNPGQQHDFAAETAGVDPFMRRARRGERQAVDDYGMHASLQQQGEKRRHVGHELLRMCLAASGDGVEGGAAAAEQEGCGPPEPNARKGIVTLTSDGRGGARDGSPRASCRVVGARLLLPDIKCVGPVCTICIGCQEMPAWMEVAMDERVSGEEVLGLLGRFEPLHLSVSTPCRPM